MAGISKILRAPDYHGDYNPQGKPAGQTELDQRAKHRISKGFPATDRTIGTSLTANF